jgi:hypothetical protein
MVKHIAKKGGPTFAPIATARTPGSTDFGFVKDLIQKDEPCLLKYIAFLPLLLSF